MNKTLRKIIAFVLVLALSASVFAVSFSVFATEGTTASVDDSGDEDHEPMAFTRMFVDFVKSIYQFFKYIFYEIFLGIPAPDIPEPPLHFT